MTIATLLRRLGASAAVVALACGGDRNEGATPAASGSVDLTGAGATFPYPLYSKWFSDYATETGVRINYQSIGSGGGIRQLSEGTVDFGASDGPMSDEELSRAKGGPVLHFPTVAGAVVVTYNVPGLSAPLKLDGNTIADIFLGRVTKWNAPQIAALNAGVALPNTDILVVHRSDGSGTTYVFTDYLTAVSPAWRDGPGKGKEVSWPTGLGAKGNEGVAGQVKQTPGAIGYVELAYATQNRLATAHVRNAAGNFVRPAIESVRDAVAGVEQRLGPNPDYRVSIVNGPGANAYPISSLTWILVYAQQTDSVKARKLTEFMRWAYTRGAAQATALEYAPLPPTMTERLVQRLDSVRFAPRT